MKDAFAQVTMAVVTMLLFVVALIANEALFRWLEWAPGINFVYLPAGVQLLCTLLFAEAGAVGLLVVSWLACYLWFFPDDSVRAFMGGILAAVAPYGAYRLAKHWYGIGASLQQLTSHRLLLLSVVYAFASPLLHHLWFWVDGSEGVVPGFVAMFVGDLSGSLIVLYLVKLALSLSAAHPARRI